jgi:hypothetical protein
MEPHFSDASVIGEDWRDEFIQKWQSMTAMLDCPLQYAWICVALLMASWCLLRRYLCSRPRGEIVKAYARCKYLVDYYNSVFGTRLFSLHMAIIPGILAGIKSYLEES